MRKFKSQLHPPNGYTFRDRDGLVHTGVSWADLEAKISAYRTLNKLNPGDVHEEVITQVCAAVPSLCYDDNPNAMRDSGDSFNWHVVQWFGHAAGYRRIGHWPRVPDDLAARRAAICAKCPMQRALNESCGACINSIKALRKGIIGHASKHQNLSPCAVQWEDCQTTVHLDIGVSDNPDFPAHCWRRPS